ncbi:MAG: tRNA (N(6)-L-threonylcarbamoyladenosine(37)-C(2))-methylthiotransferase [Candidatus Nanoarchaeia archaeon]
MKIFVKTYGCTLNQGDTEVIKGILKQGGHKFVDSEKEADIIIVNTCGVKTVTQNKIIDYLKKISKTKKVIVGGCLPSMIDVKRYAPKIAGSFDTNTITKINSLVEKPRQIFGKEKESRINKPRVRTKKEIAIITIAEGCLGKPCTYCSVKQARGELKSYTKKEILGEVKKAVKEGCTIIKLTAQDTGCWGKDIDEKLPDLLGEILKTEGNFKIRLGMMNPNHAIEFLDELIKIYNNPKMIKFIHIPVQSGSNKVIKDMKRDYKVEDFKKIVKRFRKEVRGINIATDIIAGYPTETEEDFKKTLELIKEVKPEVLNISKFAPRPKTEAAKLKQLRTEIIKERSKYLTLEYKKLQTFSR